MALFSSSLLAGLVVVTLCIVGDEVVVVAVVDMVTDVVTCSILPLGFDVSSKVGISVVMLILVTVSLSCQPEVVNSSSPLVWISVPTFSGLASLSTWD